MLSHLYCLFLFFTKESENSKILKTSPTKKAKKDFSTMNNIYIRQERVPQKPTKAQKGVRGEGIGGCANMTNLEHMNDPIPKAVDFMYFYVNPFKMMNVSYFIWKAVFFLKIFAIFSRMFENVESWLVYAETLFWIFQPYFSSDIINEGGIGFFFLFFKTFNEKNKVSY